MTLSGSNYSYSKRRLLGHMRILPFKSMATIHSCGWTKCKGCGLAAPVTPDLWPSCFGKLSYQCSKVFSVATGITKFKQAQLNVTRRQNRHTPCIALVQPQLCIVAIDLNGRMRIWPIWLSLWYDDVHNASYLTYYRQTFLQLEN